MLLPDCYRCATSDDLAAITRLGQDPALNLIKPASLSQLGFEPEVLNELLEEDLDCWTAWQGECLVGFALADPVDQSLLGLFMQPGYGYCSVAQDLEELALSSAAARPVCMSRHT